MKFDPKHKPYAVFIDIGLALILSGAVFLLSNARIITEIHPFTYVILTPIIALLLIRARKREEESEEEK
jgi:hypothetical protein